MAKKAKKDENYLDYVPAVSTKNSWDADAEPLYERLAKYMQILRNNGFIYYAGKDRAPQ